jgi:hypothetical protein
MGGCMKSKGRGRCVGGGGMVVVWYWRGSSVVLAW